MDDPSVGIDPHSWQNLSLTDLTDLNCLTSKRLEKIRGALVHNDAADASLEFYALNMHWIDPLCPAIPDGRYVIFVNLTIYF